MVVEPRDSERAGVCVWLEQRDVDQLLQKTPADPKLTVACRTPTVPPVLWQAQCASTVTHFHRALGGSSISFGWSTNRSGA